METILNFCLNVLINIEYYAKKIILAFIINILGIIINRCKCQGQILDRNHIFMELK